MAAVSDVYETDPVGGPEQGRYLNLVLAVSTGLAPERVLERCHALEAAAGRALDVRWGPRTLDVDVLWIDGMELARPELTVPHPRMRQRRFVMEPLAQVAPDVAGADWEAAAEGDVDNLGPLDSL